MTTQKELSCHILPGKSFGGTLLVSINEGTIYRLRLPTQHSTIMYCDGQIFVVMWPLSWVPLALEGSMGQPLDHVGPIVPERKKP